MRSASARSSGLSAAFAGSDLLGVRNTDDATPFGRFTGRTLHTPASADTDDSLLDDLLLSPLTSIDLK